MKEVEQEFGFPVYSVVDVYDIIEYLEEVNPTRKTCSGYVIILP